MHLLTQSSSESEDENDDFDPPFSTSLPRNHDFDPNLPTMMTSAPTIPLPMAPSPGLQAHALQAHKAAAAAAASYMVSNGMNGSRGVMESAHQTTAVVVHTPMFKSTRDENGKYHETRKNCRICRKRINTFCRDCRAALCFSDGKDPNAMSCWEKHHHSLVLGDACQQNT
jgi:hypothetical protein